MEREKESGAIKDDSTHCAVGVGERARERGSERERERERKRVIESERYSSGSKQVTARRIGACTPRPIYLMRSYIRPTTVLHVGRGIKTYHTAFPVLYYFNLACFAAETDGPGRKT
jgi:hypothetical protein